MGLFNRTKREPVEVEDVDATVARLIELAQQGGTDRPATEAPDAPPQTAVAVADPEPAAADDTPSWLLFEGVRWDADGRLVLPRAAEDALGEGYRVSSVSRTLVALVLDLDGPSAIASLTCPFDQVVDAIEERMSDGWTLLALVDGDEPSLVFTR